MPTLTSPRTRARELLDAARGGDDEAFRRLVQPHHAELHAHCYRMLASLHDAEDALQDALLRAWRGLDGLRDPGSLRTWLYRIATNSCLDAIARRPKRVLPIDYGEPTEPDASGPIGPLAGGVWVEPYPTRAWASRTAMPGRTLATSSARRWSSPSWRHYSTSHRDSAPC